MCCFGGIQEKEKCSKQWVMFFWLWTSDLFSAIMLLTGAFKSPSWCQTPTVGTNIHNNVIWISTKLQCSVVLATYEKWRRASWHRARCRVGPTVPTIVDITHFRGVSRISTVCHFEWLQEGSRKKRIHYRGIMLPACQVCCRSLSCCIYYVSVRGNEKRGEAIFPRLPDIVPLLQPISGKFIIVIVFPNTSHSSAHRR